MTMPAGRRNFALTATMPPGLRKFVLTTTMPPGLRKFVLTVHLISSVGWIGAVVAYLALGAFAEVAATMKPEGTLLLVEPAGHVGVDRFAAELRATERTGLVANGSSAPPVPNIRASRAAVLVKPR